MDRLEVRALLGSGIPELLTPAIVEQGITVDESFDEETFLKVLEETLQQHVASLNQQFLVLSAARVDRLAFRLNDALVPKRDAETNVVQAWTIQPQLQLKVKASAHLQVLKLSTILREVQRLRLHHSQTETKEVEDPVPIEIFPSLRVIEVLMTEPRVLKNVHVFASQLRELHIEHTKVTTLRQLLAPNKDRIKPWRKLTKLQMNCCDLHVVDESVNLLKAVKTLDLGWNKINSVEIDMTTKSLQVLNLCHNQLFNVPRIQSLRALRNLNLAVNQILSLKGLETLTNLEQLDISHNLIHDISEVEQLTRLPRLTYLKMEFNPIARRPDYRREMLFYLGVPIELDGKRWTDVEVNSMKNRRMLTSLDYRNIENTSWRQSGTSVYPEAGNHGEISAKSSRLVMGYPPLPRVKSTVIAHFAEIQNPTSTFPTKDFWLRTSSGSTSEIRDSLSRPYRNRRDLQDYQTPLQTVDDYFRNQYHNIMRATTSERNKTYDQITTSEREERYESESIIFPQRFRINSSNCSIRESDGRNLDAAENIKCCFDYEIVTSQPQVSNAQDSEQGNYFRVLQSAKKALEDDLHGWVDGVPASSDVKSPSESFSVRRRPNLKNSCQWLQYVVAVGTLLHSNRAKTITIKLQTRESSDVVDAAFQFNEMTYFEELLSLIIAHLYKKEISFKILIARCADEGVTIPSSILLAPSPRETSIEEFHIEEPIVKNFNAGSGMRECVMISCNGIREIATPTREQGDEELSDKLNDAIMHAMTSAINPNAW
ncbi:Leucine-rich repeat proteins [Plasmopara halstedii]|uniref:Leucine-rich repeat proteins n=1 Tax=Plasmopara halstedii TaxID=4781 RepID=A0A0P1A6H9_PLAHL|nr:Leucine-rich repeat proteins [Plasmopara halstedii]CEG36028.1 Leucine-rich repeat proteins [Plasmopara halstedii]|eukprot:XP_024572397.1 Leucine-rich repeat proteins [Plasmopara halstedii]